MNPPCQSMTEALHTATLLIYIYIYIYGNFTLLLTSCGQEWQFHIATDV